MLKSKNKLLIIKNIVRGFNEEFKNLGFQIQKLTHAIGQLNNKLILLQLNFRLLTFDHLDKELLFKTARGDSKVN